MDYLQNKRTFSGASQSPIVHKRGRFIESKTCRNFFVFSPERQTKSEGACGSKRVAEKKWNPTYFEIENRGTEEAKPFFDGRIEISI